MAIAPIEKDITPSGLTPEQIKKQAELEAILAFQVSQANQKEYLPGTKYGAVAASYEETARDEANARRAADAAAAAAGTPVSGDKGTGAKTITDTKDNGDGTYTVTYSDKTSEIKGTKIVKGTGSDLVVKSEAQIAAEAAAAGRKVERQSAYDLLYSQFKQYGLESLVEPLKGLVITGASPAEFTIKLRESDAYKKRFAGNATRIQKGLRALGEDEYLALEDQYQNVMRNYGLPASYYERDALGTQQGFTNLIAGNVSAAELENRVQQATDIIDKGPKEYMDAIRQFYPDIQRGDLLAYVLDPEKALTTIKARLGAAKIGGEYLRAGLTANADRAEYLQRQGVTAEAARQGAQTVVSAAPRGSQLASIYQTEPYGQAQVEEEVYGLAKADEARKARQKITGLEKAAFGGQTGITSGALARDRAGGY